MKTGIHPEYVETTIACACGATYPTRSTAPNLRVAICAKCHPFFTGEMKFVDTMGRVERFQKKQAVGQQMSATLSDKKKKKKEKEEAAARAPKSLKEMLMGLK